MILRLPPRNTGGFTMVELLVSSAILALIMVLSLQITSNTSIVIERTRSRIDAFQESRAAFESMTRNISQAMLNPYWDTVDAAGKPRDPASPNFVPAEYLRQSELHFISGQAEELLGDVRGANGGELVSATQCVFFQAPLGNSEAASSGSDAVTALPSLLNVSGYFLEFGDDAAFRPRFLESTQQSPLRNRFRLMEMIQPSESFAVYDATRSATLDAKALRKWFVNPLNEDRAATSGNPGRRVKRALAENIIALIILPKRSTHDVEGAPELAPNYTYDSKLYETTPSAPLAKLTRNQLPPLVQVTMVAIDEASATRLENRAPTPTTPPDFGLSELFRTSAGGTQLATDLATLEATLNSDAYRVSYRVFSTDVSILQAKWSEN